MQLDHRFTVPAPVDEAWKVLLDLPRIAPCMPGASLTEFDGEEFTGTVKVKLGPVSLTYRGNGRFTEVDESQHQAVIYASGKETRGSGTAAATITATLVDEGGTTGVNVATDLRVTGKPAQFGRGMLADVGDRLLGQFSECLATKLGESEAPESDETTANQPAAGGAAGTGGTGGTSGTGGTGAASSPRPDAPARPTGSASSATTSDSSTSAASTTPAAAPTDAPMAASPGSPATAPKSAAAASSQTTAPSQPGAGSGSTAASTRTGAPTASPTSSQRSTGATNTAASATSANSRAEAASGSTEAGATPAAADDVEPIDLLEVTGVHAALRKHGPVIAGTAVVAGVLGFVIGIIFRRRRAHP